mmetsp:Transcript_21010/g.34270  ORF Transcript_21010/g.34270 Transcript_21010/m.34270 type:complete len:118 (+) Transcript_21010:1102-1455(+)
MEIENGTVTVCRTSDASRIGVEHDILSGLRTVAGDVKYSPLSKGPNEQAKTKDEAKPDPTTSISLGSLPNVHETLVRKTFGAISKFASTVCPSVFSHANWVCPPCQNIATGTESTSA